MHRWGNELTTEFLLLNILEEKNLVTQNFFHYLSKFALKLLIQYEL